MLDVAVPLLLVALLVAANALFVAAEFSLIAVDRTRMQQRADGGSRAAQGVVAAMRDLSFQLSGAQLGITVTSLVVGFLAQPAIAVLVEPLLAAAGLPGGAATGVSVVVALLLATALQVVFGELVPKNWALAEPTRVALLVAAPQRGFTRVAGPLIRVLNGTANGLLRRVGVEPQEELRSARTADELPFLLASSVQEGALEADTARLLGRSLRFGDKRAAQVMVPRTEVVSLPRDTPLEQAFATARATGFSRFPVTAQASLDDVVGVVHVKDAFRVPQAERAGRTVGEIAREAAAVPDTLSLDDLLTALRREGVQLAVVVDEYGGTAGVVTLEDLVEELVGEVQDEYDEPPVPEPDDGTWTVREVSGLLHGDEVRDELGVTLPDGPFDSLGGYVVERLGRLPSVGDRVRLEDLELTVVALDGHRVDRVEARRPPPTEGDGEAP